MLNYNKNVYLIYEVNLLALLINHLPHVATLQWAIRDYLVF